MSTTHLLLIRHGETDWNTVRRYQGHTDIALNQRGLEQARLTAQALADEAISAVYASDLQRAQQTAQAIAIEHRLPVLTSPALRERHLGAFEGLTLPELEVKFPEETQRWLAREPDYALPEGESLTKLYQRTTKALMDLLEAHHGQTIVVIAHGGVLDCIYRFANKTPLDAPRKAPLLNASINRLVWRKPQLKIEQWGDVSHLAHSQDEL